MRSGQPILRMARNRTRGLTLAHEVRMAAGMFSRLCGLLTTPAAAFGPGCGLWITPSQGVHAIGMRYAIDALYLDRDLRVVHIEKELRPWRLGAFRVRAASVLELPAGAVGRSQTRIGDQIEIRPTGGP